MTWFLKFKKIINNDLDMSLHGSWLFFFVSFFLTFKSLFTLQLIFLSFFSRPGRAAPSRSCCLQPGSSSPTPQSNTPLSSPTPWAAHRPLPTGGEEQCFLFAFTFIPLILQRNEYWGQHFLTYIFLKDSVELKTNVISWHFKIPIVCSSIYVYWQDRLKKEIT